MAERFIHQFREAYIAIYRPNKRTYAILEWVRGQNYWKRHLTDPDHQAQIQLCTQVIPAAPTKLNTLRGNTNEHRFVKCMTSGQYLLYNGHHVAIVQKTVTSASNFQNSLFAGEFPCANIPIGPEATVPPLWTLAGDEPVPVPPPGALKRTPLGIPMRIAWIIAEDASKKGETCAITLDEVSPLTASVTSCYHVFDTKALDIWFQTKTTCPVCKQNTVATKAFAMAHEPDAEAPHTSVRSLTVPLDGSVM
jgi:hypothetical protein